MTDASHCVKHKLAGWGFSVYSKRLATQGGGVFKSRIKRSGTSEMLGIVNGLHVAIQLGAIKKNDTVYIHCDSSEAVYSLKYGNSSSSLQSKAVAKFRTLRKVYSLTIHLKHMPGHNKAVEPDFRKHNNLCHYIAKGHMLAARNLKES